MSRVRAFSAWISAKRIGLTYTAGVLVASVTAFCSPFWFLGFAILGAGLIWAAYDLVEVPDGESSSTPQW